MKKTYKYYVGAEFKIVAESQEEADKLADEYDINKLTYEIVADEPIRAYGAKK